MPAPKTLAQHLAEARAKRRPVDSSEASDMAARSHATRLLARLRPVHWPPNDPLSVDDAAFVLNCTTNSVLQLIAANALPSSRDGRRHQITQAALRDYLAARFAEARALGLQVPPSVAALTAPPARRAKSRRTPDSRP